MVVFTTAESGDLSNVTVASPADILFSVETFPLTTNPVCAYEYEQMLTMKVAKKHLYKKFIKGSVSKIIATAQIYGLRAKLT